jgi:hypothetical protein
MPAPPIHVEPSPEGRWIVRHENEREALSEHGSATEAVDIARDLAQVEGVSLVLLHDRYARIHFLRPERRPEANRPPRPGDAHNAG